MFTIYIIKGEILKLCFFCMEMNSYKALESQAVLELIFQVPLLMIYAMEIFILASVTFFTEEEFQIVDDFLQVTVWICMLTFLPQNIFLFHSLVHYTLFPGL